MGLFNSYWRGAKVFGSAGTGGGSGSADGLPTAPPPGGGEVDFRAADISDEDAQTLPNRANENAPLTRGSTGGADTFDPQLIARPKVVFDGVDDFLQTDHTPNVQQASGAFSAVGELSIDPSALPGSRIFSSETGGSNGALAFIDSAGRIAFRLRNGSGLYLATDQRDYADGVPFRFAVSVDSATGDTLLYTSRGDITTLSTLTVPTVTHAALRLFRAAFGGSSLAGTLYSFASYDTALTAAGAQSFVDPSEGWAARAQTTATAIFDMSTLVEGAQSVQNDAQANDDIATLGARRGEEVTSAGLEHPGLANNYAELDTVLDMRGDAEIYYTFAGTWGTLNPVSLATFAISENGNTDASLRYSLTGPGLEFYWQGVDAVYHVPVSVAPSAAATGIGGSRTRQSATTHHVKFYQQLAGAWVQLGPTQTVTTAADVAPATLSYRVGGHPSLPARTFAHVTETVTFINDGVALSSVDFRNAPARARSFPDEQGNTWSIVSTGVDTNDPTVDHFDGTPYFRFAGTDANYVRGVSPGSVPTMVGASTSSYTLFRLSANENRVDQEYLMVYAPEGARFYPVFSTDALGRSVSLVLTSAVNGAPAVATVTGFNGLRHKNAVRFLVDWAGPVPSLEVLWADDPVNPVWASAGVADFPEACVQPPEEDLYTQVLGHASSVPLSGDVLRGELAIDGVVVSSVSATDKPAGVDTWTDPVSGQGLRLESTGGVTGARHVTESALVFDGVDDFLQLPASATPTATKTSGGYTFKIRVTLGTEHGSASSRLFSTEASNNNGVRLYVTGTGNLVLLVGDGPTNVSQTIQGSFDFSTVGEFTVVGGYDGDNDRIFVVSNLSNAILAQSMGAIAGGFAHVAPRVFERGGFAGSATEGTLFECKVWQRALTTAEIEAELA